MNKNKNIEMLKKVNIITYRLTKTKIYRSPKT